MSDNDLGHILHEVNLRAVRKLVAKLSRLPHALVPQLGVPMFACPAKLRCSVLDLHERFENASGSWGIGPVLEKWTLEQPWRASDLRLFWFHHLRTEVAKALCYEGPL